MKKRVVAILLSSMICLSQISTTSNIRADDLVEGTEVTEVEEANVEEGNDLELDEEFEEKEQEDTYLEENTQLEEDIEVDIEEDEFSEETEKDFQIEDNSEENTSEDFSNDILDDTINDIESENDINNEESYQVNHAHSKYGIMEEPTTYASNSFYSTDNFYYTGYVEEFVAPIDGEYELEVAGAQGGDEGYGWGGYGGYSEGTIELNEGDKLYICVGGAGTTADDYSGGYNGGGAGGSHGPSGGGATHIATTNRGILKNYSSYRSQVLLVAGGGGGAAYNVYHIDGGDGGGTTGGSPTSTSSGGTVATGGTQTSGGTRGTGGSYYYNFIGQNGSFGKGGNAKHTSGSDDYGSGGGGGWYGGGSTCAWDAAGGGSGHIGNVTNGYMYSGRNSGDGWASITYKDKFTVSYNGNGGVLASNNSSTSTSDKARYKHSYTLMSNNTFTRDGYTFSGWNTKADGTGKSYNAGSSFTFNQTSGLTLYAQWTSNSVKVSLPQTLIGDKNGNSSFIVKSNDITEGTISIEVPEGFYYKQEGKDDVYARISSSDSLELSSQNKCISFSIESEGISAGSWSGTFNVTLKRK